MNIGKTPDYVAHFGLDPTDSRFVDVENMPWIEGKPGTFMKVLYKDDEAGEALLLLKTSPGSVLEDHIHTGLELTYVIEGSMVDAAGTCTAGNFVWRPPHSRHEVVTPDGAVFLTLFKGSAKNVKTGGLFPSYSGA